MLGETFQQSSSSAYYNKNFQNLKNEEEKHPFNFNSDNNETYNFPFTIPELMESLQKCSWLSNWHRWNTLSNFKTST